MERHQRCSGGREDRGESQATAFIRGSVGKARQGKVISLGLANLRGSGGLRGRGVVPRGLVVGPGWLRAGDVGVVSEQDKENSRSQARSKQLPPLGWPRDNRQTQSPGKHPAPSPAAPPLAVSRAC